VTGATKANALALRKAGAGLCHARSGTSSASLS